MSNNSIDDFKILSPSEKKELEHKRLEAERKRLEAAEKARLATEEKARKAKLAAQKARETKMAKKKELEKQLSELSNSKAVMVCIINTIVFLGALVGIGVLIGEFDGALLFLYIMVVGVGGGFVGLFIIWGVIYDRMKDKVEGKRRSLEEQLKKFGYKLDKLK